MDKSPAEYLIAQNAVDGLGTLAPDRWPRPAKVLSADQTAGTETAPRGQTGEHTVLVPIYVAGYTEQVVVTDPITLLARFLTLAETTDAHEFARFGRRWGMLGLCPAHDLPYGHELGGCGPRYGAAEAVESWRYYASKAARVLALARDRQGNDLRVRAELEGTVSQWIQWAGVTPHLSYDEATNRYRVELGSGSLFGQLAALLLYAVAGGGPRLRPCHGGCGTWIAPKGRQLYCDRCGTRAIQRNAKRAYRRRNREDPDRPRARRGRGAARG